ncbi:MAG: serine/threonine protein kinase [Clostridium sp.]|nr:serine/threonine protein kinase [Clostridium sp.]
MGKYSDYEILSKNPLGSGGNADVYLAKKKCTDEKVALKLLKTKVKFFNEKKDRFCIESKLVEEIQNDVHGIIPIKDSGLPDSEKKDAYWYVMPLAIPLSEKINEHSKLDEIIQCIIDLAGVMSKLHSKGIVHRDIKPNNIYFYNNEFCFGDFGLVDYPGKDNLTKLHESVGPKATIAPEMKHDAKNSDGKKADVYSLAKTLWMLLTKSEYGFEGTYDESSKLMGLSNYYKKTHLVELEELLFDSTREEPELRPTMKEFKERLMKWVEVKKNFKKSNLSQWEYVQRKLFGKIVPDRASWSDREDIVKVLNLLGRMPNLNHMFVPTGGGIDLDSAEIAAEEGCIALNESFGNPDIIKPKRLIVENISKDYEWSYFRLELEALQPIFQDKDFDFEFEEVTEDIPGHYESWICANYGYYENGEPLPKGARMVARYIRGSFVIFLKTSIYNKINGTYDARHNKMNAEEFREYIEILRKEYNEKTYSDFMRLANINPFQDEEDKKFEKLDKQVENSIKTSKYIVANFNKWNFKELFKKEVKDKSFNLAFSIDFIHSGLHMKSYYLDVSGGLTENPFISRCKDNHYLVYNRECALELAENCERYVKEKCIESGIEYDSYEVIFEVEVWKIGKPTHMFTKEELRDILRNGDDHKNNYLVIDENGYFRLLQSSREKSTFPVRFEGFNAFNNYVGKYSSLNHLDNLYVMALEGWLQYLSRGTSVYMDYKRDKYSEQELISKIKQYY